MNTTFDFLLEQTQKEESQAILALDKAKMELNNFYKQIKQIEQYRLDYCNQLLEKGQQGLTASEYGYLNKFLMQLDEALIKQKKVENHFTLQVDNCQMHWQEIGKQRRSYELIIKKKKLDEQKKTEWQEQLIQDELTTLRFIRRK